MDLAIALVAAVPEGEGRTFAVLGERVAVFRSRSGSLFAVQAECPHRGGPLADGLLGGSTLVCPLHAWKFDLATGAKVGGECALRTYPVRLDDSGRIVITVTPPPGGSVPGDERPG